MAAYAALVSVMNIIHDLQHHPSPPICIDAQHLQSLTQLLTSLLEYLEAFKFDSDRADPLKMRIVDAAYAAEDVIESYLVDTIHHPTTARNRQTSPVDVAEASRFTESEKPENTVDEHTKSLNFYQSLQRVIEEMNSINQLAVEMVDTEKAAAAAAAVHAPEVSASASSLRSSFSSATMVCSDAVLDGLMNKLVDDRRGRQVIPITGMGGIGKTTLARNIYERQYIKEHFDVCAWITVSQKYNMRELINEVFVQVTRENKKEVSERSEDKLKLELYQYLFGRSYLIVMDDVWSIDVWEKIQHCFPNNPMNSKGSKILVTTGLSHLGSQLNANYSLQMQFLDEVQSWELFSKTVFGKESCPPELMKIGKKIVENCRGLALSIAVVGVLLKKIGLTQRKWESISNNITSTVNLENDKHCLRLLKLSYNHLPLYLKPCFLYMGVYEEDYKIRVSTIIKLWISEGFLKPVNERSLETTAMGFLEELIGRNLITIDELGSTGKIKTCKIHDLFRDLCLNEGQKNGFYHVLGQSQSINKQCRRIVIPLNTPQEKVLEGMESMPYARSIICQNEEVPKSRNFGLFRTFHAYNHGNTYLSAQAVQYVNLRHLAAQVDCMSTFISTLHLFWNLHTLIISCEWFSESTTAPLEIWKMLHLRHIEFPEGRVSFPVPQSEIDENVIIMENLQIIKGALSFKCCEEVVKRIPNLKKLSTKYFAPPEDSFYADFYYVSNIQYLSKLEALTISHDIHFQWDPYLQDLSFPHSLKKLTLEMSIEFGWEEMLGMIGSLPHLEKLKLWAACFGSGKWEIEEGQFPKLKYLGLFGISSLKQWTVQGLPCLEQLHLNYITELEAIPSEIGEIATLQKINLDVCSEAVVRSAKAMVDSAFFNALRLQVYRPLQRASNKLSIHKDCMIEI